MINNDKTKEGLIEEITLLRKRLEELEKSEGERKQTEEQSKISRIHQTYLTKYANDLIILLDDGFHFLEINERVIDSYGYTKDELIGMHATQLRAPETKGLFEEQIKPISVTGKVLFETVHQRKDGTKFPVEISLRAIDVDGKRFYQAIIRDITERKKLEEQAKEHIRELEIFYKASIGREERIIALKKENEMLKKRLGE